MERREISNQCNLSSCNMRNEISNIWDHFRSMMFGPRLSPSAIGKSPHLCPYVERQIVYIRVPDPTPRLIRILRGDFSTENEESLKELESFQPLARGDDSLRFVRV